MCRSRLTLLLIVCYLAVPAWADPPERAFDLDRVGAGELFRKSATGLFPLPVIEVDVEISVTGIMTHGRLTQSFFNPTPEVIEVLYAFPLPDGAAVNHMEMRIGDRRIVSTIREKKQARRTYEQAKQTGRKAALVDQHRPNLFTAAAANINPGETVEVVLEYFEEVTYRDGAFGLRFPLTYIPRFTPPSEKRPAGVEHPTGPGSQATFPWATVEVRLRPGLALERLFSDSHAVKSEMRDRNDYSVRVASGRFPADRDFELSWEPAREAAPQAAVFVEDRTDGRYALLMLMPPAPDSDTGLGLPTETLFIVDVSSSMDGPSIVQARQALLAALNRLRSEDRFNLLKFNDGQAMFREEFQQAVPDNLDAARDWVRDLRATGGTMIYPALLRGLELLGASRSAHSQRVIFLTDGAVANEQEVLRGIHERLGRTRLHTIGIGHAPNAFLMRKIAFFGRGICEFVSDPSQAENKIDAFFARLDRPVMTDLELTWEGVEAELPAPHELPDLHAAEPLWVSMRLSDDGGGKLTLAGYTRDGWGSISVGLDDRSPRGPGIAVRWARARIDALTDLLYEGADDADIRGRVVDLALAHHLVTRYTSLVAVEQIPDALGPSQPVRLAAALPQGGTDRPLRLLLGSVLSLAGLVLSLALLRRPL